MPEEKTSASMAKAAQKIQDLRKKALDGELGDELLEEVSGGATVNHTNGNVHTNGTVGGIHTNGVIHTDSAVANFVSEA